MAVWTMRVVFVLLVSSVCVSHCPGQTYPPGQTHPPSQSHRPSDDESSDRTAPADRIALAELSDAELLAKLENANLPVDWDTRQEAHRESILNEILRRANPDHIVSLRKKLWRDQRQSALEKSRLAEMESDGAEWEERKPLFTLVDRLSKQLDVLTTLRRLEHKRDPLTVVIRSPHSPVRGETRSLPTLKVSLKNQDVNDQAFQLMFGGNYRSGRHMRWRVHVWDSEGNLLPVKKSRAAFIGGGLYSENDLTPGETWDLDLPLGDYVEIETPGEYTAQVLYHNVVTIADADQATLDQLIVSHSDRFPLQISRSAKTRIELTAAQFEFANEQIKRLRDERDIRVVFDKYDESYHRYLKPDTPAGQLLSMHWQAVPAMIGAIQNDEMSFHSRGWLLLLLFAITMEEKLDPINPTTDVGDILPSYRYKTPGGNGSMWRGRSDGDVEAQIRFARRWKAFAETQFDIVITE